MEAVMMKILLMLVILAGYGGLMMGCNTVHGLGKDVERGGEKIQEAAEDDD
jgi:entericidin B